MLKAARCFAAALAVSACASANGTREVETAKDEKTCALTPADHKWLTDAIAAWKPIEREFLGATAFSAQPPVILAFDQDCTYAFRIPEREYFASRPHETGFAAVPGPQTPIGPAAFQSDNRVVIALPSIWRAAGVESVVGIKALVTGIFLHEMSHTLDFARRDAVLKPLQDAGDLPSQLDDDLVQETFGEDEAYVAAFDAERTVLFAAVDAPTDADARRLAGEALKMMRERRARWFIGERAALSVHEDIFLASEGFGQWVNYRYLRSAADTLPEAVVRGEVSDGGSNWLQDHGLALMLLAERLLPDWKTHLHREPVWRAEALLAAIAQRTTQNQ